MAQPEALNGAGPLLGGSRHIVDAGLVLKHVLERIHAEFGLLLEAAPSQNDGIRKRALLEHLHAARQQLLRLAQLVHWHPKSKALVECVDQGKVLDVARQHAQMLDSAAVELFEAYVRRQPESCPMLDVTTALEVLGTGSYNSLPSVIGELCPEPPLPPKEQAAKLRRITHLIYSHLLKVTLPPGVTVATVGQGFVVLKADGLYEAKLTLVPAPDLPLETDSDKATAEAGAAGGPCAGGAANPPAGCAGEEVEDSGEATSGPKPVRWRWLLLSFVLPANAVRGAPLKDVQVMGLLQDLNNRMHLAADAAVYAQRRARTQAAAEAAAAAAAVGGPVGMEVDGGAVGAGPTPSVGPAGTTRASTMGPTPSTAVSQEQQAAANKALLAAHESDTLAAPLMIMHCVLSDVGGRLLLDACMGVATQLVGAGGKWQGHAQVQQPRQLRPGLRITYWTKSVPLLPSAVLTVGPGTPVAGTLSQTVRSPTDPAPSVMYESPCLEIGLGAEGGVQVLCTPIFTQHHHAHDVKAVLGQGGLGGGGGGAAPAGGEAAGEAQGQGFTLRLDAATVNLDELLLRAAAELATHELEMVKERMERAMTELQLGRMAHLQLRHTPLFWTPQAAASAAERQVAIAAAGGSSGSSSSGNGGGKAFEVVVACPVLEVYTEGLLVLRVSRNLLTGRVRLQPGSGSGSDAVFEAFTAWAHKEEEINAALQAVHSQPGGEASTGGAAAASGGGSGSGITGGGGGLVVHHGTVRARVLDELVQRVLRLVRQEHRLLTNARIQSAARQLQLQPGNAAWRAIIKDPSIPSIVLAGLKRHIYMFSFPPFPFPSQFPLLHSTPATLPPTLRPRGLVFSLGADLETSHRAPTYSLLMSSTSDTLVPVSLLKVMSIPPQVYAHALPSQPMGPHPPQPASPHHAQQPAPGSSSPPGSGYGEGPQSLTMVAQHASYALLAAVVQWCHRRMVMEILTVQLKAVGAECVETMQGSRPVLHLVQACGVEFPCRVRRRPGLTPAYVGVTSVVVHLSQTGPTGANPTPSSPSPNSMAAPGHVSSQGAGGVLDSSATPGPACLEESSQGSFEVVVTGRFFANTDSITSDAGSSRSSRSDHGTSRHVSSCGGGRKSSSGSMLCALKVCQPSPGVLRLHYSLSKGHTALDVLSDIASVLRMQTFLARLEGMAVEGQQLRVQGGAQEKGQWAPEQLIQMKTVMADGQADGLNRGLERVPLLGADTMGMDIDMGESDSTRAAKRARVGAATELVGGDVTAMANGDHSNGHAGDASSSGSVLWRWERNGAVQLSQYTPTSALINYRSPSTQLPQQQSPQQPQQQCSLHVTWVKGWPAKEAAGVHTLSACCPAPTSLPELVVCSMSEVQGVGAPGCASTASGTSSISTVLGAARPVAALLKELSQMADAGEEGMLLDTLHIAAWPMHDIQAAAAASVQAIHGMAAVQGLVHVADGAPFRHKLLVKPSLPASGSSLRGSLGAGGSLCLDFAAMAVGRTWVRLRFVGGSPTPTPPADHTAADGELLQSIAAQLLAQLGPEAVHVAHAWSSIASVQLSWPGQYPEAAARKLWILVDNAQLRRCIELVLKLAGAALAVKKQEG